MCRAKELVLQLDNILKELEFEYKKIKSRIFKTRKCKTRHITSYGKWRI
jgi:hypothetical protein